MYFLMTDDFWRIDCFAGYFALAWWTKLTRIFVLADAAAKSLIWVRITRFIFCTGINSIATDFICVSTEFFLTYLVTVQRNSPTPIFMLIIIHSTVRTLSPAAKFYTFSSAPVTGDGRLVRWGCDGDSIIIWRGERLNYGWNFGFKSKIRGDCYSQT